MEPETYSIELGSMEGHEIEATVELTETGDDCTVTLRVGAELYGATAMDYFEAFLEIRHELQDRGLTPLCYGACRNVFPSTMSRQMGGGIKAYRLTLGQPGRTQDLVDIFDRGAAMELVSPEEQAAFYKQWLASLGETAG